MRNTLLAMGAVLVGANLVSEDVREKTAQVGGYALKTLLDASSGDAAASTCTYNFDSPSPVVGASDVGIHELWPTKNDNGLMFTETNGTDFSQKYLPDSESAASDVSLTGSPVNTWSSQFIDNSSVLFMDATGWANDVYEGIDTSGDWTSGSSSLYMPYSTNMSGGYGYNQQSGEFLYAPWNGRDWDIQDESGSSLVASSDDEIEPSGDTTDGRNRVFYIKDTTGTHDATYGAQLWVTDLNSGCTQEIVASGARSPFYDQNTNTLYFASWNGTDYDIEGINETIESSSGGTDTGTEDAGDTGSGDTGGTDTDTGGTDTGDSGDTGDSADTNDSGDSGDTGDTSDTGGVDPDCTEELTGGSRVTESAVTADESTKICVPGSTTAFELSGPATVVTEDSDGDGLMDHATVTLEEGGTADIVVDPSGDYTVDLDYSTRTETEDGAVVEGGTVASLDAGDHLDVGAGVDAFMAVQSNWNACDENGEQSDPMDTPDASKWLYVDVLEGDVDVNGKNDMRRQSLAAGQFGTYADAFLCENAAEDTGDTGPEDTAVDTGDTSDTAKDTARETADTASETGTNPPDQTNCGCASTPLEEGKVAFGLALAGLAVGAARRRK
jgi:hypothetical protein